MQNFLQLYKGDGTTIAQRQQSLPLFANPFALKPNAYIATPALRNAVNVAITLGQPLLVTGEPGTGKTRLAYSVAHELNLGAPLVFNTKTTSVATDLFYRYDSIAHFRTAQFRREGDVDINDFIHYEVLGKAILLSMNQAQRAVVLIDEIDKAPRDFPNDLLFELERFQFSVKESGQSYRAQSEYRPIVIMTSNSEKGLPDAFLRRCVYCHIPFPDRYDLERIVEACLQFDAAVFDLPASVEHFEQIRQAELRKKPATAELLNWIYVLNQLQFDWSNPNKEHLKLSYSVLAKSEEDLRRLHDTIQV